MNIGNDFSNSIPSNLATTSIRQPLSHGEFLRAWDEWKNRALAGGGEFREIAFHKLLDCLDSQSDELNLFCLGLRDLPPLPPQIKTLHVSNNKLTELPMLPDGLTRLDCKQNRLTNLPVLPAGLKHLDAYHNKLTALPFLPDALEILRCGGNNITCLTYLPSSLKELSILYNELTELIELPAGLEILFCNNNQLRSLPCLPDSIIVVNVEFNQLNELPAIPAGVTHLCCRNNQLTRVPESLAHGISRWIDLQNNPLSERTLRALYQMANMPENEDGPVILFSMAAENLSERPIKPLVENIAAWFPSDVQTEMTQKFTAISAEENAQAFSQFLARLLASCNAKDDKFKPLVAEWLTRLLQAPELRAATFAAAIIAVESCEDRVTLAWNDMQQAELICRIKAGEYDDQWPALVDAGRVMFRLQQLELIAREKVKTLRFIDEIEVYLAFQTELSTRLQLTAFAKEMRFYEHAGISEAELKAAALRVKTAENTEFAQWFARWEPWHSILERNNPDVWAAADQQRRQHYPDDYEHRLNIRLQDISISVNDEDAKRNLGREVMQEIDREIFVPLTESVLLESQLRLLSTNPWNL